MASEQRSKIKFYAVIGILILAVLYLMFGHNGLLHVRQLKREKAKLEKQIIQLEEAKNSLQLEIEKLQSNPEALEKVIREQMGMIRKDEMLFIFPKEEGGEP